MDTMDLLLALLFGRRRSKLQIFNPGDKFRIDGEEFKVINLVGEGGFGAVYKCVSIASNRVVCVKVTLQDAQHDEIAVMRRLHNPPEYVGHPNLLPLLAYGEIVRQGTTFRLLCTPFVKEGAIADKRRDDPGRFTEGVVKTIMYEVASALAELHSNGILHGDVSPANILVEKWTIAMDSANRDNVILTVKTLLSDFGISRVLRQDGTTVVTAAHRLFRAPEVVNGSATTAADVYSLGATMMNLLYGIHEDYYENTDRIQCAQLRAILKRCLKANPEERYRNAQTLWAEGLGDFRWNQVEETLPWRLRDRFLLIVRAKKEFWMGVGAAARENFSLVVKGTS